MIRAPLLVLAMAAAAVAPAALAQQPAMKVLVVESVDGFQDWLRTTAAAGTAGTYPPSLKEVPEGRQIHFPIVVSGLRPPAAGVMELVADVEFVGPDGVTRVEAKQCCRFTIANQPEVRTVMLGPTTNTKLLAADAPGIYTVRATVTGGPEVLVASETFRYVGGTPPVSAAPAPAAAPRLNMNPPARNPGDDSDKRDCLALPTPTEVIKCTERKR
ncbi:hypothetical protein DSM104443_01184 [Usitatibacter rugosus]|uniref:Uncharacterized protein n=1 Tax=Usitatibacter rugosus TaxID=2732067 RepID=A0A6M4GS17_9PROT|nr:hypothetical protein [Usitatibacter rugosus]QJR10130.1 hypothetical protein DSM104443_01184 [Usitatibacter rugosus]